MYKNFISLLGIFFSLSLWASVSGIPNEIEKRAEQVREVINKNDISGVTARLRVEGAEFKNFNLFFPPTELGPILSSTETKNSHEIRTIIERDLGITGGFKIMTGSGVSQKVDNEALLRQKGAEGVTYLSLGYKGPKVTATIQHRNFVANGKESKKVFEGTTTNIRRLAHQLAQHIYENFIGPEDIFLRQIAAVKRINGVNQIVMVDFDGFNETQVSFGPGQKVGPSFAPDGKTILYTSITDQSQRILEQEIGTKNIQERTNFAGSNLDPRVLPNNSGLIVALSLGKTANIYKTDRSGGNITRLTEPRGLNISPTISFDSKKMAFVSDRAGTAQIYELSLEPENKNELKRLTKQGSYNQTPQYSPDAKFIAFTGRDEAKVLDVFLLDCNDLDNGYPRVSRITQNQGGNKEPSFTPSGRFVIFSSQRNGHKDAELYLASLNGSHQHRLTHKGGYVAPVVRPGPIK
jgi:TolB protein